MTLEPAIARIGIGSAIAKTQSAILNVSVRRIRSTQCGRKTTKRHARLADSLLMVRQAGLSTERRQVLRWLGSSALVATAGGCGPGVVARDNFDQARLAAIVRGSFITEIEAATTAASQAWALDHNAQVTLSVTDEWRARYRAVAKARRGEDIAELFGSDAHEFADDLVDVTELAESMGERLGPWIDAAAAANIVDGRWRAIPWSVTSHFFNYRADIVEASGLAIPSTYDEVLDFAVRLHEQGLPPAGLSMSRAAPNDSASLAYSMLWAFGAAEVDETGTKVALNSNATRQALSVWKELTAVSEDRALAWGEGGNNDAFIEGRIALTQNATSILSRARNEAPEVAESLALTAYPSGPAGAHQLVEVNSLAIFKHSRNREAALSWIEAMSSEPSLRERASLSLAFFSPPLASYLDDPEMPWNTEAALTSVDLAAYVGAHLPGWPGVPAIEATLVYGNQTIVNMFAAVATGESIERSVQRATTELIRVYET